MSVVTVMKWNEQFDTLVLHVLSASNADHLVDALSTKLHRRVIDVLCTPFPQSIG